MVKNEENEPTNKLNHILRNERDADFYINTPRGGNVYKPRKFKNFVTTFDKAEHTKMEAERVSPFETHVKIWLRGYGNNSYMLITARENVLIDIPEA